MGFGISGSSGSLVPEITNQHEEGNMDPFPLVMFLSFGVGELFITVSPKLRSSYSKEETPASKIQAHFTHTHTQL